MTPDFDYNDVQPHCYGHFIDGSVVEPAEARWLDSVDPSNQRVWARIARGDARDVDRAVAAAHRALCSGPWRTLDQTGRAELLLTVAEKLETDWPELVEAEVRDNGKRVGEVRAQFAGLHQWYRHFAEQAAQLSCQHVANDVPGVANRLEFEPYGVVAAITPWNSPLMIAAWKLAPALAAGNTVVLKPSEHASVSTLLFAALVTRSGLPPGVVNVVTGLGTEVGAALVRHRQITRVSFTGSDTAGTAVARDAVADCKPVTLELGGKSPQLVFADANLDNTVNGILSGIALSNGQSCVAGSRVIVHSSIHDALLDRLCRRLSLLRMGHPMDPATEIGPLANRAQYDKVLDMIHTARAEGARCLYGGNRARPVDCPDGLFVEPAVFVDVTPAMQLWHDEVFGPVLAVTRFDDEDDAVTLANDSVYGLAAGIWTTDSARAERVARRLESGTVYINHYRSVSAFSPIGGYKRSGIGRELGPSALHDYLQVKSVWHGTLDVTDPFPPASDRRTRS